MRTASPLDGGAEVDENNTQLLEIFNEVQLYGLLRGVSNWQHF